MAFRTTQNKIMIRELDIQAPDADDLTQHSPPFVVQPTSGHTHTVILLHGFGSNGGKFGRDLLSSRLRANGKTLRDLLPGAKFVFPTAVWRRACGHGRAISRRWFCMTSLTNPEEYVMGQLRRVEVSCQEILGTIKEEAKRVPSRNILLGGFSQGMALALLCLLSLDHPLGGFVGKSGWMAFRNLLQRELDIDPGRATFLGPSKAAQSKRGPQHRVADLVRILVSTTEVIEDEDVVAQGMKALSTPVFLSHGSEFRIPSMRHGEDARDTLREMGFDVRWKVYEEGHQSCQAPEWIGDIVDFMRMEMGWELA